MPLSLYIAAAIAGAATTLTPGPAFLAVLGIGASQGRRAGLTFLLGHFAGDIVWATLALVAIIPMLVSGSLGVSPLIASFYGGTGLLIAVSVAFDLVQKIDSHLVMRNYKGLLES